MTDDFEQRLRDAARTLPTPDAPDGLVDRVIAERAGGARIILPTEPARSSRSRLRSFAFLAIAASVAAIAVLVVPGTAHRGAKDEFVSDAIFGSSAYAEQRTSGPLAPPLAGINAIGLAPRSYRYRIDYVTGSGQIIPDGGGTLTVVPVLREGVPAWRMDLSAEQTFDENQRRATSETVFVSRRELRPLERAVHTRPYRHFTSLDIAQRFVGDSVLGQMRTDSGIHRPIARRLPAERGPYLADAYAPVSLAGVPLSIGKTMAFSVVGWAVVPNDVFYSVTLRVVGEEKLSTYDCWTVEITAGSHRRTVWVRKSDNLGLRSLAADATPKGRRRFELINP
jgi:hypothetical protein